MGSVSFLLLDLLELLLLEGSWLGELEGDLVGSKLGVGVGHAINLALNEILVKWVKEDTLVLSTFLSDSDGTSSDAGWANNVVEDSLVDCLESSASWSLLRSVSLGYRMNKSQIMYFGVFKEEREIVD